MRRVEAQEPGDPEEMLPEYDFSKGVRGKYAPPSVLDAERLAESRVRARHTIADVAAELRISPARVAAWEAGEASPSKEEREHLETLLAFRLLSESDVRVRAFVWVDGSGVAWIDDTNRKVREVAEEHVGLGWTAKQIHEQHPDMSLAQIHAALAYYYDHQESLDAELAADAALADELRRHAGESPIARRLVESRRSR
jgi:uncharacterized protein (DUF433 family)